MRITHAELIKELAEQSQISQAAVKQFFTNYHDVLLDHLTVGDTVSIPTWGLYRLEMATTHTGYNSQTKEWLQVSASRRPAFSPATSIKDFLNK